MSKGKRKNKKNPVISIIIVVTIAILGVVGFFGYKAYEKSQENKIYSAGDVVNFPDFDFRVTKAEFKAVDLPIDQKTIAKYGALDKPEDCEKMSKEPTMAFFGSPEAVPYGPSDFNICIRRNDSRSDINEYSANNKQFVADYEIVAKNNVSTSNLKIALVVDSGRKLDEQVSTFNGTQFFTEMAQERIEFGGVKIFAPELGYKYIPYHQNDIGSDINKGLTRIGYAYTDIRNNENNVDIKVTYKQGDKEYIRIVRVNR